MRSEYGLPPTYVFAVGTVQPRKNYARLAAAVRQLNDAGIDVSLVIAGKPGWRASEVEAAVALTGARVHWLGYVPESDLPAIYGGAIVTCQPSLFEGFGMPAIEAMASGSPLVAASSGALPEICGEAATLVDPHDVDAITKGLREIITRPELRSTQVARGLARSASFSWQSCALETLEILRTAAA